MATFVQIEPDAFALNFASATSNFSESANPGPVSPRNDRPHVRRPVRGIQIKDDTYATIQVKDAAGNNLPLFDSGSTLGSADTDGFTTQYSNFLIQSAQESRSEKQQVILTFGEPYIFFFGENPRTISFNGVLLNTEDFNWRAEWWENYDKYLRGTKCVENKTRIYISWDDIVVEGYIIGASASETAEAPYLVQLQFQIFLTNYHNISRIGDPYVLASGQFEQLDPTQVAALGQDETTPSSTLAVRQANMEFLQGDNTSLLGLLRQGQLLAAVQEGTNRIQEFNGQVVDMVANAQNLISAGRSIRVSEGAAGFVNDSAATVLSGIAGALDILDPDRKLYIPGVPQFDLPAVKPLQSSPATYGPLFDNWDEFVDQKSSQPLQIPPFDPSQFAFQDNLIGMLTDILASFGTVFGPPPPAIAALNNLAFSITQVVGDVDMVSSEITQTQASINYTNSILTGAL